jgi:hypothetical protein
MCRFFLCIAESSSDGQEHKWICFSAVFDLGKRTEDVDEIATSLHHDQMLRMRQPAFAVRVDILVDADDGLVCADEQPCPDSLDVRQRCIFGSSTFFRNTTSGFNSVHVIQAVEAQTEVAAALV